MSYQSQYSIKGKLLNNILKFVDAHTVLTTQQVSCIINELARITLSYRPTFFFQAAYAETRSARVLIANLKDHKFNGQLPLRKLLFEQELDLTNETDSHIIQRLRDHKTQKQWEDSCDQIQNLNFT